MFRYQKIKEDILFSLLMANFGARPKLFGISVICTYKFEFRHFFFYERDVCGSEGDITEFRRERERGRGILHFLTIESTLPPPSGFNNGTYLGLSQSSSKKIFYALKMFL